jgi:hypothetical protein
VNLGVAKDQRLSLNPSQISGACGRLMCCLRYEHEFYVQSRKRFPKEGKIVVTKLGEEKIASIDIFHERVTLRGVEGETRTVTLVEFKQETEEAAVAGVLTVTEMDDDESTGEEIRADEISPELLYTAEHKVVTIPPGAPGPSINETSSAPRENDPAGKRRRGRRGGRRGRGEDNQSGNQ